jgi:hypothetical protein
MLFQQMVKWILNLNEKKHVYDVLMCTFCVTPSIGKGNKDLNKDD